METRHLSEENKIKETEIPFRGTTIFHRGAS